MGWFSEWLRRITEPGRGIQRMLHARKGTDGSGSFGDIVGSDAPTGNSGDS